MTPNPIARRFPARVMKRLGAFLVALLWLWSAGFVAATAQSIAVGLLAFAAYPLALAVAPWPRRRAVVSAFGALAGVALALFFARWPSNDRGWEDDQAVLPAAEFRRAGDGRLESVLVRNIRDFRYRSTKAGDWEPRRYDKRFDLSRLERLDFGLCRFPESNLAAHTFLSFGFGEQGFLCVSAEIRKERGEKFSVLRGLYRNYEIMYVIGDERDLIALRTNYRGDSLYLYPTNATPERAREIFRDVLRAADGLRERPAFYNTVSNNCSSVIRDHVNHFARDRVPYDFRVLFPARADEILAERGHIVGAARLDEARRLYLVNGKARQYRDDPFFSWRIRGLQPPGPEPSPTPP
jgi:hypothetical protein